MICFNPAFGLPVGETLADLLSSLLEDELVVRVVARAKSKPQRFNR